MQTNFDLEQINKQLESTFRSPAAAEKYTQLIEQRNRLLENQTGSEMKSLEREINEIKQRQLNAGARRYQLLRIIDERAEAVMQIQPELDAARQQLDKANLDFSFFEQGVSEDRIKLNYLLNKLNTLTEIKNEQN